MVSGGGSGVGVGGDESPGASPKASQKASSEEGAQEGQVGGCSPVSCGAFPANFFEPECIPGRAIRHEELLPNG